ncbi:hypothetical protein Rsub_11336 [Raphidocelis subcapitata]|uniref:Serine protease n=1 Tax=Raphidocelis subcapitata TaxID=307507 RepID=A0A2V0PIS7_9CHLO|nr:hypothetical protein Rsub_11336 [Raphidocelis subcapitata]|eukprot:GBF97810.1 hypothetical protein Rsub_11336 [Raphidocelis subcapitata]
MAAPDPRQRLMEAVPGLFPDKPAAFKGRAAKAVRGMPEFAAAALLTYAEADQRAAIEAEVPGTADAAAAAAPAAAAAGAGPLTTRTAPSPAPSFVGRVRRVASGAGRAAAGGKPVGSCALVRLRDGAFVTAFHVYEAATEGGCAAWVELAGNNVAPFEAKLLRHSAKADLALLVPASGAGLQLPAAVPMGMGRVGDAVQLRAYPQVVDKEMGPDPEGIPCLFEGRIAAVCGNESLADYTSFGNCSGGAVLGGPNLTQLVGVHLGTISPHEDASDWQGVNEQLLHKTEAPFFASSAAVMELLAADRVGMGERTVERERSKRRRRRAAAQQRRWGGGVFGAVLWPLAYFFGWGGGE